MDRPQYGKTSKQLLNCNLIDHHDMLMALAVGLVAAWVAFGWLLVCGLGALGCFTLLLLVCVLFCCLFEGHCHPIAFCN